MIVATFVLLLVVLFVAWRGFAVTLSTFFRGEQIMKTQADVLAALGALRTDVDTLIVKGAAPTPVDETPVTDAIQTIQDDVTAALAGSSAGSTPIDPTVPVVPVASGGTLSPDAAKGLFT